MIYEHAQLTIAAGRATEFETAFERVPAVFAQAPGCHGVSLRRCVEEDHYLLVVEWETLEDHTVRFRESELFTQWRAIASPFFAAPPRVLHYAVVR